ncbi:Der1-like family protein [Babesia bovis T2Bo]|uniref:Derlin n=1 Tax=Babesia bovis TaxID=5865 RepID=A7APD6_BABBO|nr:Der1-like family protein [Babesia bovis T2Bo]EDO08420.1 Der1-like family protein [Babesia bovis T2Bo]|eukprot:XP_001611988.1 Der1-like family protein [Babesia bovis T2Bo]
MWNTMDGQGPEAWYASLPKVTKTIITSMFILTLFTTFKIISLQSIVLDWQIIRKTYGVHRILLACLYAGQFSFRWVIQAYMFSQFSTTLERNPVFSSSVGSYLYFILIEVVLICLISLIFYWPSGFPFLNDALMFSILYYWSKRDMWNSVSIYVFTVKAYQLPYAMLFLNFIMGAPMIINIIGMIAGHIYYLIREVLPTMGYKNYVSKTPHWIDYIAGRLDAMYEYAGLNMGQRPFSGPYNLYRQRPIRIPFTGRGVRLGTL